MTGLEMVALQAVLWSGVFLLLHLMAREKHEPVPDFVRTVPLLAGFLLSALLLTMWLL